MLRAALLGGVDQGPGNVPAAGGCRAIDGPRGAANDPDTASSRAPERWQPNNFRQQKNRGIAQRSSAVRGDVVADSRGARALGRPKRRLIGTRHKRTGSRLRRRGRSRALDVRSCVRRVNIVASTSMSHGDRTNSWRRCPTAVAYSGGAGSLEAARRRWHRRMTMLAGSIATADLPRPRAMRPRRRTAVTLRSSRTRRPTRS
jgi:hypothetical protein